MTEVWLDYSGARPDPRNVRANGVTGVIRYLSEPVPATSWKRISAAEKDAILAAGLDLILNWEWYEGRMLEGAAAGAHDGAEAAAQARALGYPKGATIYFSHDTSARNDAAVIAYLAAAQRAMGGYYQADIYGGIDVVEACIHAGVARYGWQTLAWSRGLIGRAHIYQNGRQWYNGGADENVIRAHPLGSWRTHGEAPSGGGVPIPAPVPANTSSRYTVASGDSLSGIATRYKTTVAQLMAWNPIIKNANVIQVGWVLVVGASKPAPKPAPHPAPAPTPSHQYRVVSGDSLTAIAVKYHTTVAELVGLNPSLRANPNLIKVGQLLNVPGASKAPTPAPKVTQYRIASGDTLSAIASRHHTTVNQLVAWNRTLIKNPNLIHVGWVIRVA